MHHPPFAFVAIQAMMHVAADHQGYMDAGS
jgi:hypothetical protein